ncbi:MAG TPA: YbdD/YjiX family protein [Allosphingosinicella sp.]|nr:YbdD/YjiX family protein [Allosphingosinicella sp.]
MPWREALRRAAETARLMVGVPDYGAYLAHRRARHPGEPAMTRAEFHRDCAARRYGGISRCC